MDVRQGPKMGQNGPKSDKADLFYTMSFSLLYNQNFIKGCENVQNNLIILLDYLIVRFLSSLTV